MKKGQTMNLKLCFLTPEQEKQIKDQNTNYTKSEILQLGLLANGVSDLVSILEMYELHDRDIDHLTTFQTLKRLIEPIEKYFNDLQ